RYDATIPVCSQCVPSVFNEPPDAEPHVRWCERATGVTPSPTRSRPYALGRQPFNLARQKLAPATFAHVELVAIFPGMHNLPRIAAAARLKIRALARGGALPLVEP
ncbi:MAG: hypothetical protein WA108_08955, partial [Thiobacillus sp.]